jgi:hypothetical protein
MVFIILQWFLDLSIKQKCDGSKIGIEMAYFHDDRWALIKAEDILVLPWIFHHTKPRANFFVILGITQHPK